MFQREIVATIAERMLEDGNPLIQVVAGPRQTGKSTAIVQALERVDKPAHSVSADDVIAPDAEWLRTEWQQARNLQRDSGRPAVLVLDEVQKGPAGPTW